MGRSVDHLSNALYITYFIADPTDQEGKIISLDSDTEEEIRRDPEEDDYQACFDDLVANVTYSLKGKYPSLTTCSRWDGRETRVILENDHCEIGIASYGQIVSVSIRININGGYNYRPNMAEAWINRVWPSMRATMFKNTYHQALVRQGAFSNGESIYAMA